MIDYKDEDGLKKILAEFEVPELRFVRRVNAGPDEELYFYEDSGGVLYGVWERDYMSELEYEEAGLKKNFGVDVTEWMKRKKDDDLILNYKGNMYAMFKGGENVQ
ncbi:hypothetical protein IKX73_02560 [Candidatus Saccharibacteria bacterium]|nr:hypothetical protein [Candidatus Saccharibacteria bacterium]